MSAHTQGSPVRLTPCGSTARAPKYCGAASVSTLSACRSCVWPKVHAITSNPIDTTCHPKLSNIWCLRCSPNQQEAAMPGSGAHASSQVRVACAFSSAGMLPVLGALGACALRARLPGAPVGARAAWRTLVPRRAASARRARRQRSSRQQRRARGNLCHLPRQTESPQPVVMVSEPILMVSEQEPRQKLSKGGRSGDTRPSASCGQGAAAPARR